MGSKLLSINKMYLEKINTHTHTNIHTLDVINLVEKED